MKYMLIMRATDEAYESFHDVDFNEVLETMGRYNDELIKAGVLVAAEGLDDPQEGIVVDFSSQPPVVTDGPYGETKELFNGFWIIEASTREEAAEWASRAPLGAGSFLEVRRVTDESDFPADNEWIEKEKGWREEEEARRAQQ